MTDYREINAVNYSTLKYLRPPDGSPAHYRYMCSNPPDETPAMILGRLIHTAVFEPDRLMYEYMAWEGDRRGNAYKQFAEEAAEVGRTVVKSTEWEQARAIRDSLMAVPEIAARLDDAAEAEAVLEWTDPGTGIRCKGRADWLADDYCLDLKTTANGIEPRRFGSNCWYMGYWFQAAMYQDGISIMRGGDVPRMGIIAVETKPPYCARLYWLADKGLIAAWDEYQACLRQVKDCRESGVWPGPEAEMVLDAPGWVSTEYDADFSGIE